MFAINGDFLLYRLNKVAGADGRKVLQRTLLLQQSIMLF